MQGSHIIVYVYVVNILSTRRVEMALLNQIRTLGSNGYNTVEPCLMNIIILTCMYMYIHVHIRSCSSDSYIAMTQIKNGILYIV